MMRTPDLHHLDDSDYEHVQKTIILMMVKMGQRFIQ